ncbi:MAG: hypothetical protein IKX30_16550 [Victivallales bacterium]|nr:hypothetical protein [Victivallales bacterium]
MGFIDVSGEHDRDASQIMTERPSWASSFNASCPHSVTPCMTPLAG